MLFELLAGCSERGPVPLGNTRRVTAVLPMNRQPAALPLGVGSRTIRPGPRARLVQVESHGIAQHGAEQRGGCLRGDDRAVEAGVHQ